MYQTIRVRLVNSRLPDFIKPKRYEIELTLETGENIFYGECRIMIMILKATQNISLHSANLEITEVILTGKIDKYVIVEKARDISYIHELQIVVLDFSEVLRPGNYTLSITYKGVIANDGGFVKVSYINAIREKKNQFAIAGLTDDGVDKLAFVLYSIYCEYLYITNHLYVVFREEDIIYNEKIDPIARKIELSRIIGRKVVGQLFGTAVSPSWWSCMWLNEGIATLFGVYTINQIMPDSRMLDLFVVQTQQESLRLDDSQVMNPLDSEVNSISEINSLFSFTYYIKGIEY
ncbi:hypothetical protein P5V15_004957 [Pogonomyrmex californicus]